MNRRSVSRLAILLTCAISLNGCGGVKNDGYMFQRFADQVAEIPVTPADQARIDGVPAAESSAEVHASGPPIAIQVVQSLQDEALSSMGFRHDLQTVSSPQAPRQASSKGLRGMIDVASEAVSRPGSVQLGAFPSEAAARLAWRALAAAHPQTLGGLTIRYERADLGPRGEWVRLKAEVASADQAERVCAAVGAGRWCAKAAVDQS